MEFKREITVGNLLTAISVAIALSGLLYSQWRDRVQLRNQETARVQEAVAAAVIELERVSKEGDLFFFQVAPAYVLVSHKLGEHRDRFVARDQLWRMLSEARAATEANINRGSLLFGAQTFATAYPEEYYRATLAIRQLSELRSMSFARLAAATEIEILTTDISRNYESATLGNALRKVHAVVEQDYRTAKEQSVTQVRKSLESLFLGANPVPSTMPEQEHVGISLETVDGILLHELERATPETLRALVGQGATRGVELNAENGGGESDCTVTRRSGAEIVVIPVPCE